MIIIIFKNKNNQKKNLSMKNILKVNYFKKRYEQNIIINYH